MFHLPDFLNGLDSRYRRCGNEDWYVGRSRVVGLRISTWWRSAYAGFSLLINKYKKSVKAIGAVEVTNSIVSLILCI